MAGLTTALDQHFELRAVQRDRNTAHQRLWLCSRVTAWRDAGSGGRWSASASSGPASRLRRRYFTSFGSA